MVGGGPTGLEVAGQIAELATRSLRRNYRGIDPADAKVVLLEAGPALLATFGAGLSERTRRDLAHLDVEVHTNARVTDVDADTVRYIEGGQEHLPPSTTKVCAAVVAASPLGALLADAVDVHLSRSGQVEVLPDCSCATTQRSSSSAT